MRQNFPRVYRRSGCLYVAYVLGIAVWIALGIGAAIYGGVRTDVRKRQVMIGIGMAYVATGFVCLLDLHRRKVTLRADRIEIQTLTRAHVVRKDDIAGWRERQGSIIFELRNKERPSVQLERSFRADDVFHDWLDSLPNFDQQERATSEEEIANDAEIGIDRSDREQALQRARKIKGRLDGLTIILSLWGMFSPRLHGTIVAILILLPLLIVAFAGFSRGLIRFSGEWNDAPPNALATLVLPGFILTMHVFSSNFYHWPEAAALSVVIGVALTTAVVLVDSQLRATPWGIGIVLVFSFVYGYGAGVQSNKFLDYFTATTYRANVIGKKYPRGSKSPPTLLLDPWGPYPRATDAWVSEEVYESTKLGDSVCVQLRRGALFVKWYRVERCPGPANANLH